MRDKVGAVWIVEGAIHLVMKVAWTRYPYPVRGRNLICLASLAWLKSATRLAINRFIFTRRLAD